MGCQRVITSLVPLLGLSVLTASAAPEGVEVLIEHGPEEYFWGPAGVAAAPDGWVVAAIGSGCGSGGDNEFASHRFKLTPSGEPAVTSCSRWSTSVPYCNRFTGGSMTTTPRGYAWAWHACGERHYIETFDASLDLVAPVAELEFASLPDWGPVDVGEPTLVATSRVLVDLDFHTVAYRWVTKRRLEFDGSGRSFDGPLSLPTTNHQTWYPYSHGVAAAWDGERLAAVWPEWDGADTDGRRLMIRFLDADSRTIGPAHVVASYPGLYELWAVSVQPTTTGWVLLSVQSTPGRYEDTWLLFLDPTGRLLRSQWLTPDSYLKAGGQAIVRRAPNGDLGILYDEWLPDRAHALRFMELDENGRVLREPTRVPAYTAAISYWGDLAWSGGRWGILWRDSRSNRLGFAWYAAKRSTDTDSSSRPLP